MAVVDISRKNKAEVLCALYDASRPAGAKNSNYYTDRNSLTISEAELLLRSRTDFEYIKGHVMKIDLSNNLVDTTRFNLANGPRTAEAAIESVPDIFPPII